MFHLLQSTCVCMTYRTVKPLRCPFDLYGALSPLIMAITWIHPHVATFIWRKTLIFLVLPLNCGYWNFVKILKHNHSIRRQLDQQCSQIVLSRISYAQWIAGKFWIIEASFNIEINVYSGHFVQMFRYDERH